MAKAFTTRIEGAKLSDAQVETLHRSRTLISSSTVYLVVPGYAFQDAGQGLRPDLTVQWDNLMMLAVNLRRDPDVGAALSNGNIAQTPKCLL